MSNWHRELQKKETRRRILNELRKGPMTFNELKEKASISRSTLTNHLKRLRKEGAVRKVINDKRDRPAYLIAEKALIEEVIIEGMIQHLGTMATHSVLRTKLGHPNPINLEQELEKYLRDLGKSEISPKKLFDALEKKYPVEI